MPGPLVVLPSEPRQAVPRRPLARGTKVTEVQDRQLRLHPVGEKPWRGREDDHRDRINVERHRDAYIAYKPSIGAVSALHERDYLPFHVFMAANGDRAALARYYVQMGKTENEAQASANLLATRLERDGWTRTEIPTAEQRPLMTVYLTVTRYCDLGCPYCYQGLNDRVGTDMTLEQIRLVLERIKVVNPKCQVNITGGEPFTHSGIHEILDMVEEFGLPFIILSNGTYIDERAARHLKELSGFRYIQISLDGITPETHEMTRGKGHFPKAMAGIQNVIDQKLPFKLAPTLHNANMHELSQIGELALANGGWVSPNQLKELPHSGLDYRNIVMSHEEMMESLRRLNDYIVEKFGLAYVAEVGRSYIGYDPEVCSVAQPNSTFICGMAHSLMDIDWNGDVYPCHLSKGPDLKIGNIFEETFDSIFQTVKDRGVRVKSNEIEKCSGCKFVSTCAGGCRAGAWFTYGTLQHEDELCDISYPAQLRRLLVGAGVS